MWWLTKLLKKSVLHVQTAGKEEQRSLCEELISSYVATEDTCKLRLVKPTPYLLCHSHGVVQAVCSIQTSSCHVFFISLTCTEHAYHGLLFYVYLDSCPITDMEQWDYWAWIIHNLLGENCRVPHKFAAGIYEGHVCRTSEKQALFKGNTLRVVHAAPM